MDNIANRVASYYDPKLPDSAIATVPNGELRLLRESLTPNAKDWTGFDRPGSDVAPRGSL